MILAVIGLLLPMAAAWMSLRALRLRRTGDSELVTAVLAGCVGLGLSSLTTFISVLLHLQLARRFAAVDAFVSTTIGLAAWWVWRRNNPDRMRSDTHTPSAPRLTAAEWAVRTAFVAIAAIVLATVVATDVAAPHGEWDAWAVWNQKARFLVRDSAHWTTMLEVPWSNPSHQFFVSLSVARLWAYAGSETTHVPAMLGILWGAAIVVVVMGALDTRRARAWIAGSVLIAPATFPQLASAQTADLAEGLFIVATLVLLCEAAIAVKMDTHDARRHLMLAGFLGSVAAWTKNEGLLLVAVATLVVAWIAVRRRQVRDLAWWLAGVLPLTAVLAWFKLAVAPLSLPYTPDTQGSLPASALLFDPARHVLVASLTGPYWLAWGAPLANGALLLTIAAAAFAALTPAGRSARLLMLVVVLMLVGYEVVIVISALDPVWLVSTTFNRLLIQVWPTFVLVAFAGGDGGEG